MSFSELTFFDTPVVYLPKTDSTNDYLKNSPLTQPLMVYTDYQTSGRGQYGRVWEAKRGENLLFSFQYFPQNVLVEQGFVYSQMVALAIVEVLDEILHPTPAYIKWPNDIIVNNKKIAGVLIENSIQHNFIQKIVVGIGLNLYQTEFDSHIPNAISIQQVLPLWSGKKEEILARIIQKLEYYFSHSSNNMIHTKYNEELYRQGQTIDIIRNGEHLSVVQQGVNSAGNWLLENIITQEVYVITSSREVEFVYS